MPRRFIKARELLDDLLDRHEAGAEAPVAYPDHDAFPSVTEADAFARDLVAAERAGGVTLVQATGRRRGELKLVRLVDPTALYAHLGREPASDVAVRAGAEILASLQVNDALRDAVMTAPAAWARGRTWCNLGADDVQSVRTALILAQAILEEKHLGLDYRTFSRRIAGNSKALEKLESAVLRLLGAVLELPPAAGPRAALATLGLERFGPPLLMSGSFELDGSAVPAALPYLGIPPDDIARIGFPRAPAYVLTIENFASFSRHATEADPERVGLTLYVGGYPSLATQRALQALGHMLPDDVPFFHWSDIDPDGTWIFRTIERVIGRDLRAHLMTREMAETYGDPPTRAVRLRAGEAAGSAIADLVDYLAGPDAKVMEQEEIDPVVPVPQSGSGSHGSESHPSALSPVRPSSETLVGTGERTYDDSGLWR